jgi:hypothetical protein
VLNHETVALRACGTCRRPGAAGRRAARPRPRPGIVTHLTWSIDRERKRSRAHGGERLAAWGRQKFPGIPHRPPDASRSDPVPVQTDPALTSVSRRVR